MSDRTTKERNPRVGAQPRANASRKVVLHKIPVSDATALTLIADYPDMPDEEFSELVDSIETPRAKKKAREIRRISARLHDDPDAEVGSSDSALFARSVMAGSAH